MINDCLYREVQKKPEYAKYLYRYGFFMTDERGTFDQHCSFLKEWNQFEVNRYTFWLHPDQRLYLHERQGIEFFLVGHCYDPFTMVSKEEQVLQMLADSYALGVEEYCKKLSDLTGIFVTGYILDETVTIYGDAAGMMLTYYGLINGHVWVGSHASLIGDLNGLIQDRYVQELVKYRFYHLFGLALPGDLSPYDTFRRLVPNHSVCLNQNTCTVKRFYPDQNWNALCAAYSLEERVKQAAEILSRSMTLIPTKWERPAISLTGGCDSKTTLACANGRYEHYKYFSYVSQESERVDAEGAHRICEQLGLPHEIYQIPERYLTEEDAALVRKIICAGQGNIGTLSGREIEKRAFLAQQDAFDVEVKSWVSEIARAYYHKRFDKKRFLSKPTPRYLTTLYKVFFHDRKLVQQTDKIFADYRKMYLQEESLRGWSWLDLFFWEFRVGAWNGLVITGEHRYSYDITIPYNNRRLLELLLAVPEELRIQDELYQKIRAYSNRAVDEAGIQITNLKHTAKRAKLERLYLEIHSRWPW